jgi:tetratricopeptide (TPR) repeat protein
VAGIVVLVSLLARPGGAGDQAPVGPGDEALVAAAQEAGVPAERVVSTFSVTEPVRELAAQTVTEGASEVARGEKLLDELRALHGKGLLQKEPVTDSPPQEPPATAGELAKKLLAKEAVQADAFEMASLLHALARAKGLSPVLAERVSTRNAATSLRRRELGVLLGEGSDARFFDPWNDVTDKGDAARVLSPAQFAAYGHGLRALFSMGQSDKAAAAEDAAWALKLYPESAPLLFLSGQLKFDSGGAEFGLAEMEKAVAAAPDALGWYNLGVAYARNESRFKGFQAFQKAVELDPRYAPGWLAIGNMELQRLASVPASKHEEVLAAAEQAFTKAKEADPNVAGLAVSEAQLLLVRDKPAEAKARLEQAIEQNPKEPDASMMLGQILFDEGKVDPALDRFEAAALLAPERPELRQMLSMAYGSTEKWDRAVTTLRKLLEAAPGARDLRPQLATALQQSGSADEARAVLESQAERFPDDRVSKMLLAQLLIDAKEHERAIGLLREVAEKETGPEPRILLYLALQKAGKPEVAAKVVEEVAAGQKDGRLVVAQVLLEQGEVQLAIEVLRDAIGKEPANTQAAVMLATALRGTGQAEAAEEVRKATLSRVPEEQREPLSAEFAEAFQQIDAMIAPQPNEPAP